MRLSPYKRRCQFSLHIKKPPSKWRGRMGSLTGCLYGSMRCLDRMTTTSFIADRSSLRPRTLFVLKQAVNSTFVKKCPFEQLFLSIYCARRGVWRHNAEMGRYFSRKIDHVTHLAMYHLRFRPSSTPQRTSAQAAKSDVRPRPSFGVLVGCDLRGS